MKTTTSHVGDAEESFQAELTLERDVPIPGFRIIETLTLAGHDQGYVPRAASSRIVHGTQRDTGIRLKRRIPAEEDGIAHTQPCDEASTAGSNHVLVVQSIGQAKARLDIAVVNVRVMVRNAAEQAGEVELIRVRLWYTTARRRRKLGARYHHAVV